ncbi:hypothetical protein QFC22_002513 [Naganishia vaughanmartiniae]|uniref:Uncharacterized protein n=1 Tax=Naganishia vaughanmartiniae TaxID=1424756 RepID=A0ACC2XB41_9TREE|nr:hypothetical protein QFC22_002513 [Naganishia vaughanmartiniae]
MTSYDNALESRQFVGVQGGALGDLWGVTNLFTYNPEGTSLQRVGLHIPKYTDLEAHSLVLLQKAKLAFEEEKIAENLAPIIGSQAIKAVKIDTSYGDGIIDVKQKGTENGGEVSVVCAYHHSYA